MSTQPFELPEFYVPHPARLNPHVDTARAHSTQWAEQMGMLDDPSIWTLQDLESHDYGLLCAYTHPRCDADELNLITDWYVWVFYFDDHFLQRYKKTRDLPGAKAYLERLRDFMPMGEPRFPRPTHPVERGLVDLWARTVPAMNGVLVIQDFLSCGLQEAVNIANDVMTASLREFQRITDEDLPVLFKEQAVDAGGRAALHAYVRGLQQWLCGDLAWYGRTRRYTDLSPSPAAGGLLRVPAGPTGLGTHQV
jgi:hypothetical protein